MNWLSANYKWLFDGFAGAVLIAIAAFILKRLFGSQPLSPTPPINNSATLTASPSVDNSSMLSASPHVEQHVHVNAGAPPRTEPRPHRADAEPASLGPLSAREVLVYEGPDGIWLEASTDPQKARRAVVLPFRNVPKQPGLRTARAANVSPSLIFKSADGSEEVHVSHGVWLGRFGYSATFDPGETHALLVVLKDVPYVTLENLYPHGSARENRLPRPDPAGGYRQMKAVSKAGTVEVVLVDGSGVTMFEGVFDYGLGGGRMTLRPRNLATTGKVHFVPDPYNIGWAGDDGRTDVRAGGVFTYEGKGTLTVVEAFLKGTTPLGKMLVSVLTHDGMGQAIPVNSLKLDAHVPVRALFQLPSGPAEFERGRPIRGQLVLLDNYNKEYETGLADFPWIGSTARS